jgi:hypothetical protein
LNLGVTVFPQILTLRLHLAGYYVLFYLLDTLSKPSVLLNVSLKNAENSLRARCWRITTQLALIGINYDEK